jgi:hypothetical protein
MLSEHIASRCGDRGRSQPDDVVRELIDAIALEADQVVVSFISSKFVNGDPGVEHLAGQNADIGQLPDYSVHRGKSDRGFRLAQAAVDVVGREVTVIALVKYLQDLQSRLRHLEPTEVELGFGRNSISRWSGRGAASRRSAHHRLFVVLGHRCSRRPCYSFSLEMPIAPVPQPKRTPNAKARTECESEAH